ncbi:hypothetical protein GGR53DRAFT_467903 [Hypoxylon sp. FL1150]|nr:hypothetical protein GGR53DRAFT_467903 [Hypoxylon sp. FL1150]
MPDPAEINYLAGCTDSTFKSPQCPDKGQHGDQQYVRIVSCDDEDEEWSGCFSNKDTPDDDPNVECECDLEDLVLTTASLSIVGSLPSTQGGTIAWYTGMKPTSPSHPSSSSSPSTSPKPKPTSTSAKPSTPSTQAAASTSMTSATSTLASTLPPSAPAEPLPTTTIPPDGTPVASDPGTPVSSGTTEPSTSTATYVGVGVGVGVGAILIGCLLYLALLLRKRKRTGRDDDGADQMAYMGEPTIPVLPPAPPGNDEYPTGTAFFSSELPADGPKKTSSDPNSPESVLPPHSPQQRQYNAYNPLVHGNYVERRESARSGSEAAFPVSPWSATSHEHSQQGNQGITPAPPSNPTQVHELAG